MALAVAIGEHLDTLAQRCERGVDVVGLNKTLALGRGLRRLLRAGKVDKAQLTILL